MREIPERAFVFAKRMKARDESESSIRSVLSEFDLSEKEVELVLTQAERGNPFRLHPAVANSESASLLAKPGLPYPLQAKSKQINPRIRAKNEVWDYILILLIYSLLLVLIIEAATYFLSI
jgi:hypothetical protein